MSYALGLNETRAHYDTAASQVATVDYFYTRRVVFRSARTNPLLLPPPSVPNISSFPPFPLSLFCKSNSPLLLFSLTSFSLRFSLSPLCSHLE